jgi:ABC-type nickel/cobalt efflux system permease component RcnA
MRRLLLASAVVGIAVAVPAAIASAHPLGNTTSNTYAGIVVGQRATTIDYVVDLAELPSVQARQRIDADGDGEIAAAEADAYRAQECAALRDGLTLRLGGGAVPLVVAAETVTFPPGQAGLATTRLECTIRADATVTAGTAVAFTDRNLADRLGWREVVLNGDGVTLQGADAGTTSISGRLTAYPTDGRVSPRQFAVSATASPGGPRYDGAGAAAVSDQPQARGSDGLTQALSNIVGGRELTVAAGLLAVGIAVVLGAFHSLAPGHGKTMMAAAIVGRRGTGRQVLAIGGTVAATHTTGVLVLGTILWLTQALAPDQLLPWLTVASGGLLAVAGATLLYRRLTGRGGLTHGHHHTHDHHDHDHHDHHGHDNHDHHGHAHDDHHDHDHHGHAHDHHGHDHLAVAPSRRWLVTMGMAGGLVPTPSALVVLLGATALGRAWFGVVLVAAYGIGMALTLLGAGLLLVRFQDWLERRFLGRPWWSVVLRLAPVVTAGLLVTSGIVIAVRGLATT